MLNQFRKFAAVKTCALACIAGLTLNTFAIASISSASVDKSVPRSSSMTREQNPSPSSTPARPGMSPAKDNQAKQADQGRQYGQSGFVGEPINLNVVNADIRDILNYITEQYGINFVIDSSVGAVPVTVNVQGSRGANFEAGRLQGADRVGLLRGAQARNKDPQRCRRTA